LSIAAAEVQLTGDDPRLRSAGRQQLTHFRTILATTMVNAAPTNPSIYCQTRKMGKISGCRARWRRRGRAVLSVRPDQKKDKTILSSVKVTQVCRTWLEKISFSQAPNVRIMKGLRARSDVPRISVLHLVSKLL
jgi:hypothetical protein